MEATTPTNAVKSRKRVSWAGSRATKVLSNKQSGINAEKNVRRKSKASVKKKSRGKCFQEIKNTHKGEGRKVPKGHLKRMFQEIRDEQKRKKTTTGIRKGKKTG